MAMPEMPKGRAVVAVMLLLATFVTTAFLVWNDLATPLNPQAKERLFVVHPGWDAAEIARALARQGFIRSALVFRVLARLSGRGKDLEAGSYLISPSQTPAAILALLAEGRTAVRRVTIPEGFTVAEIAQRLASRHIVSKAAFLAAARHFANPFLVKSHPVRDPAEGFLFPATYAIPVGLSARDIVRLMFDTFRAEVSPAEVRLARKEGLSVDAWVTLASIVERETRLARERPLVAAVFLHRLRIGMPLQSDATVLYALGARGPSLDAHDLQVASPYNTYAHRGLPPGPIANPGLASLQAVLHPARVGYLYFVGRPDGSHIFSDTYQEQLQAEAEVARGRRSPGRKGPRRGPCSWAPGLLCLAA
jgi:UPF0755 protein